MTTTETLFVKRGLASAFIPGAMLLFVGFCLITNTAGDRRTYLNSAIPLTIQLNSSTPSNYVAPIQTAMQTWFNVPGSYWQFTLGANTSASSVAADGINLLFFDLAGVNFPPPTSVIAFSSTFTSSSGGFHATESDLIWNARDFPPSPTGAPGQQDLQSVVTHELGHHLGLDHTGLPGGATSGCGPQVPAATMWWSSASGDTTKRSLDPEDVMGVCVLYPSWKLQGTVTNNSTPLNNFPIWFKGSKASTVGPVENPIGSRYNRSGFLLDTLYTDISGQYSTVAINQDFDIVADGYGYERDSLHIHFDPAGGIGQTQTITQNIQVQQTPLATISGIVRNANTQAPVSALIKFYGTGDPNGLTASVLTQANGTYNVSLRSKEFYRIVVLPAAPYIDQTEITSTYLQTSGGTFNFDILPAQVVIVDDDAGASLQTSYQASFDRLNVRRRTFSIADSASSLATVLSTFQQKPFLVWFTGQDSTNALTLAEKLIIINHLRAGGKAIVTGQNIAQFAAAGDTLLEKYFGIQFNGNSTSISVRGFGGDVIGNGINYLISGGPGTQNSKDIIRIIPGSIGTPTQTLYYFTGIDSSSLAGVRVVGPNNAWAATYFAFGIDGIIAARQDTFIVRSIRYFDQIALDVEPVSGGEVPAEFALGQNYPNPFNPTTSINYNLPEPAYVSVRVYDLTGREVRTLFTGHQNASTYQVVWNGKSDRGIDVASGMYLYKVVATGSSGKVFTESKRMMLLK